MLRVRDVPLPSIKALLSRYDLALEVQADGAPITGSFWGDSEAGLKGNVVYVRDDTPVHSLLHETCHVICMSSERRASLETDAGGDDIEEAAVCYLQLVLADEIDGADRDAMMCDMDTWGYSFRLGATRAWFEGDAEDARKWLIDKKLLDVDGRSTFLLRR